MFGSENGYERCCRSETSRSVQWIPRFDLALIGSVEGLTSPTPRDLFKEPFRPVRSEISLDDLCHITRGRHPGFDRLVVDLGDRILMIITGFIILPFRLFQEKMGFGDEIIILAKVKCENN